MSYCVLDMTTITPLDYMLGEMNHKARHYEHPMVRSEQALLSKCVPRGTLRYGRYQERPCPSGRRD